MLGTRQDISLFWGRHPRTRATLYQVFLCIITFESSFAITLYGPDNVGWQSSPHSRNPTNSTTEIVCKYGSIVDYVDIGPFRSFLPQFILCPSTLTFVGGFILYLVGITHWIYLNRDDAWQGSFIAISFIGTLFSQVSWKRLLPSMQAIMPFTFWMVMTTSSLWHPFARWAMPNIMSRRAQIQRAEREREERERQIAPLPSDIERFDRHGELREVSVVEIGENEETPLAGQGSESTTNGTHVDLPVYNEFTRMRDATLHQ